MKTIQFQHSLVFILQASFHSAIQYYRKSLSNCPGPKYIPYNYRMVWVGRHLKESNSNPLSWAGMSLTRSGCSGHHPTCLEHILPYHNDFNDILLSSHKEQEVKGYLCQLHRVAIPHHCNLPFLTSTLLIKGTLKSPSLLYCDLLY